MLECDVRNDPVTGLAGYDRPRKAPFPQSLGNVSLIIALRKIFVIGFMEITLYLKYLLRRLFVHGRHDFFKAGYRLLYPEYSRHGMTPWQHYVIDGSRKGYDNGNHPPARVFFPEGYLLEYPDVKDAKYDPWRHYAEKGRKEGRDNGLHPKEELFSAKAYLEKYPDVAGSGMDAWHHYVLVGRKLGRETGGRLGGSSAPHIKWPEAQHLYSMNVLLAAELSLPQCKLYRVDQKAAALEKQGYKVFVSKWSDTENCIKLMQFCSVVIFYRVPDLDAAAECFKEAKRLGLRIIYDIDDLIFNEEIYASALSRYNISEQLKDHLLSDAKIYRHAMLRADENWFSTKTLCDVSDEEYATKSICIPNSIPEELSGVAEEFYGRKHAGSTVKIFYGAASPHDKDVELVQEVLEEILTRNENTELVLIGDIRFNYRSLDLKKRITKVDRLGLKDYYYLVSQCDIAVIPLESSLFNSAKSNIKYIEASVFGIPSVCSDLYEFSSVIRNGENGFIAKNRDEWISSLQTLIDSSEKREAIGSAARRAVLERYSLERLGRQMSSLIEPYTKRKSVRETVMVVNVLYGVSSFGGATVVAERLAEEIQANSSYEVHVFSTYTDLHDPLGTLRRYSYNGVNVWAVNVESVNLGFSDRNMQRIFAQVMDLVEPKLVHFHCIQTLGVEMCEECAERGVPYYVTIHDGWWNCARQFLVDLMGHYCGDQVSSCSMCKNRCDIQNSDFFSKRHIAQLALENAERVYTPSHYFSDLIQRNFPTVEIHTNKNGIIQNKKDESAPEGSSWKDCSKIVLGYFGGRDIIKGYFFLKKCLESFGRDADNFKIVFIDTAKRNGSDGIIKNDTWPVETEIDGYTPHDKMYTIYRKIDVLLFPSEWKESFGLMVREAIYNDVFVVCSDCGGPREAVVNNENGLIFPMDDSEKFKECLRFLIKNKDYIKNYKTKNFGDVRTFRDQALELLKDFESAPARVRHEDDNENEDDEAEKKPLKKSVRKKSH